MKLLHGDCLELMNDIPDVSIDMILCDLPYGTTACKWDIVIPFEPLWAHYRRVIKTNGAIVLFGGQPFSSALVMSNIKWFKTEWIWEKDSGANFVQAKNHPLKVHESILVFGNGKVTYNPIMVDKGKSSNVGGKNTPRTKEGGFLPNEVNNIGSNKTIFRYPRTIQKFNKPKHNSPEGLYSSTQKPVQLLEYLIKTYTNEGETVLDNTMGSGSTGVAAKNLNRKFIGIEMDENYFNIAKERIEQA
ncbi:MAG: site-specific DNA-methyltransferase [Taibaiella sp.]|jgi:site-specific DNA-methyltransferase (adenine-specific)